MRTIKTKTPAALIIFISLILVISFLNLFVKAAYADGAAGFNNALNWIIDMQYEETGLVESYEGPEDARGYDLLIGWLYDQALSIIVFTQGGEIDKAEEILDVLSYLQRNDGGWYDGYWINEVYNYQNIDYIVSEHRKYVGANSWMVLAIVYYTLKTGNERYLDEAQACADWILNWQIIDTGNPNYGAIKGGVEYDLENDSAPPYLADWISTEFNCDAYRALKNLGILLENDYYINQAEIIKDWIFRNTWNVYEKRFNCGYNDPSEVLDAQTFTFLAFQEENPEVKNKLNQAIMWAKNNLAEYFLYSGNYIKGFRFGRRYYWGGYREWPQHIWWEGTAQIVKVFQILGDRVNYDLYLSQLLSVQRQNGGIPYSFCPGCNAILPLWPHNIPNNSVASACWFYLTSADINPFIPNFPPRFINCPAYIEKEIGGTVSIQLQAEDPNIRDELAYSITEMPPGISAGDILNPGTGEFNWTPDAIGKYRFVFEVVDSKGGKDSATVIICVIPKNKPNLLIANVRVFRLRLGNRTIIPFPQFAEVKIKNTGNLPVLNSQHFYLAYNWNPQKRNYSSITIVNHNTCGIPAGGSISVYYVYLCKNFEMRFFVDYSNMIDESNEEDNEYRLPL